MNLNVKNTIERYKKLVIKNNDYVEELTEDEKEELRLLEDAIEECLSIGLNITKFRLKWN